MRTDGSRQQKISDGVARYLTVVENRIYYMNWDDRLIYSIDTDGKNRQQLNNDTSDFMNVVGDKIYYVNRDYSERESRHGGIIYVMGTDGSDRQKVSDHQAAAINVVGDTIYFVEMEEGRICSISTTGSRFRKLDQQTATDCNLSFNVVDDRIYYSNYNDSGNLYSMKTDGSDDKRLNEEWAIYINILNDRIFYFNMYEAEIYTMLTDGSKHMSLDEFTGGAAHPGETQSPDVSNEIVPRIVFINNHQENPSEYIELIFEGAGYTSSTINLAIEDIPDDTVVLVSVAPKIDFSIEEIEKLEWYFSVGRYLGGNLIILYDPELPELPLLDRFIAGFAGVTVDNGLIFDEDPYIEALDVIFAHVVDGGLPFTAEAERITTNNTPMGVRFPRPLLLESQQGGPVLYPLIQTFSNTSYAKDISSGNIATTERENGDQPGPFIIASYAKWSINNINNKMVDAHLIIAGATLFDDTFLDVFGNAFYNMQLLADLANDMKP